MKDTIVLNRFRKIIEESAYNKNAYERSLDESLEIRDFNALDPVVKSLIEETVNINGIAAQMAINLTLIGFTECSIDKKYTGYSLYDDRIATTIVIKFDEPFVIDWETSLDDWYISQNEQHAKIPCGTAIKSLNISLYAPSMIFGLTSEDGALDSFFAVSNLYAVMPNGESCVKLIAIDESKNVGDESPADLVKDKIILSEMTSTHIMNIRSIMLGLMNEYDANEEKKYLNGKDDDSDLYEIVDDEA